MRRSRFERVTVAAALWAAIITSGAMLAGFYPFGSECFGLAAGVAGGTAAYFTTGAR